MTTENLADFGQRELAMVEQLLKAQREQGLPEDFNDDGVKPMMNLNSGYVFLTNADFQVAMMNGSKLESFYSTPYEGHEGFKDDLLELVKDGDMNEEDIDFILNL